LLRIPSSVVLAASILAVPLLASGTYRMSGADRNGLGSTDEILAKL
jgi:hypothetical protein